MSNALITKLEECQREIDDTYAEITKAQNDYNAAQKRRMQRLNLALSQLAVIVSLTRDAANAAKA
jgi:flagellar hook-associated protein FlgK